MALMDLISVLHGRASFFNFGSNSKYIMNTLNDLAYINLCMCIY